MFFSPLDEIARKAGASGWMKGSDEQPRLERLFRKNLSEFGGALKGWDCVQWEIDPLTDPDELRRELFSAGWQYLTSVCDVFSEQEPVLFYQKISGRPAAVLAIVNDSASSRLVVLSDRAVLVLPTILHIRGTMARGDGDEGVVDTFFDTWEGYEKFCRKYEDELAVDYVAWEKA